MHNDYDRRDLERRVGDCEDSIKDIEHALNGNGRDGLKTTVRIHGEQLTGMTKFRWLVISSVVAGIIAAAIAYLQTKGA